MTKTEALEIICGFIDMFVQNGYIDDEEEQEICMAIATLSK